MENLKEKVHLVSLRNVDYKILDFINFLKNKIFVENEKMANLEEFQQTVSDIIEGKYQKQNEKNHLQVNENLAYYNPFDFVEKQINLRKPSIDQHNESEFYNQSKGESLIAINPNFKIHQQAY